MARDIHAVWQASGLVLLGLSMFVTVALVVLRAAEVVTFHVLLCFTPMLVPLVLIPGSCFFLDWYYDLTPRGDKTNKKNQE
jgi:hypothetical protein